MGSNAERQKRWRAKRSALVRAHPEVVERVLVDEAARWWCERGEMSDQDREALANKLADAATGHQWRATELARWAMKCARVSATGRGEVWV